MNEQVHSQQIPNMLTSTSITDYRASQERARKFSDPRQSSVQRGALQRHAATSKEIDAYTFESHVTFNHATERVNDFETVGF
jgi:hypothetical protein